MVVGTLCLEVWWSMELNEAREGWKKEGGREANPTYLDPICSPPPWLLLLVLLLLLPVLV
jgi:hypothetical protein